MVAVAVASSRLTLSGYYCGFDALQVEYLPVSPEWVQFCCVRAFELVDVGLCRVPVIHV